MKNILIATVVALVVFFSASQLSAQQLATTYTPSLELVSNSEVAGKTVFVYRLTGDVTERTQYGQWLREMSLDNSVISSLEVDKANSTCTITLTGVGSAERGAKMQQDFDAILRQKDQALKGPNAAAERELQNQARNSSSSKN